MARLRYAAAARDDLINIAEYIAPQSESTILARQFTDRLRRKCADLAASPFSMGRSRPELRPDMRSVAFGNYVSFFRYSRSTLEVVNILEGTGTLVRSLTRRIPDPRYGPNGKVSAAIIRSPHRRGRAACMGS